MIKILRSHVATDHLESQGRFVVVADGAVILVVAVGIIPSSLKISAASLHKLRNFFCWYRRCGISFGGSLFCCVAKG